MASEAQLEEIRRSMMDIHRLALSHIVAADHASMIRLVGEMTSRCWSVSLPFIRSPPK